MNDDKNDSVPAICVALGSSEAGKTTLLYSFLVMKGFACPSSFTTTLQSTSLFDMKQKLFTFSDTNTGQSIPTIRVSVVDTMGQEKFNSVVSQIYHRCNIIILVVDSTNPSSLNYLLDVVVPTCWKANEDAIYLVAVNKVDLFDIDSPYEKEINLSSAAAAAAPARVASRMSCDTIYRDIKKTVTSLQRENVMETSGLMGFNVNAIFLKGVADFIKYKHTHSLSLQCALPVCNKRFGDFYCQTYEQYKARLLITATIHGDNGMSFPRLHLGRNDANQVYDSPTNGVKQRKTHKPDVKSVVSSETSSKKSKSERNKGKGATHKSRTNKKHPKEKKPDKSQTRSAPIKTDELTLDLSQVCGAPDSSVSASSSPSSVQSSIHEKNTIGPHVDNTRDTQLPYPPVYKPAGSNIDNSLPPLEPYPYEMAFVSGGWTFDSMLVDINLNGTQGLVLKGDTNTSQINPSSRCIC